MDRSYLSKLVLALLLLGTGVAHAQQPAKVAGRQEVNHAAKVYHAEDYWQPLDRWLKAQGSPLSGKDFYEVGLKYHLDPDFLIAVTYAETSLGRVRQRGSACNVGSVGSYDSTNTTFACTSYRHGIEQIAQTVTNRMLSRYTKVSELSCATNCAHRPIYASSPDHWNANTIATMNRLKGKHEVDYVFRK